MNRFPAGLVPIVAAVIGMSGGIPLESLPEVKTDLTGSAAASPSSVRALIVDEPAADTHVLTGAKVAA